MGLLDYTPLPKLARARDPHENCCYFPIKKKPQTAASEMILN